MLTRRSLLIGAGASTVGVGLAGAGVYDGFLPGRPFIQERLGLNGPNGVVPDIAPGQVSTGAFVSRLRGGVSTGWALIRPPQNSSAPGRPLPLVIALHGGGGDHSRPLDPDYGLPQFLAAAVRVGVPAFAIATVDGGPTSWRDNGDGKDSGAMVFDEFLPLLADQGLSTRRVGLLGWSMGGYGALRLGGAMGPDRVSSVCAVSPALNEDGESDDPELSVTGYPERLSGIDVRIDCGTGDPFYRPVQHYVASFAERQAPTVTFEPGGHTTGYRRRMLPAELAFLGSSLTAA